MVMGTLFFYGMGIEWFDSFVVWIKQTFSIALPSGPDKLYLLTKVAGVSALWILILAFWVNPLHTYVRFDLREFKKLLGGFAVTYAALHLLFFIAAHQFAVAHLGKLFFTHLFLSVGLVALVVLAITPNVKAWYKLLYIGVVLVIIHLLLGYRSLSDLHITAISLLSLGLALRLIKR
jgi:methionine sulfoxide reductase heme-binding subunit